MTEKTIKNADKTLIENDGHRRIAESVDMTKTPQQERDDPKRGQAGRPDATTK
jgi:hypothetical protein